MSVISDIIATASANKKHIVLAEGLEPRIAAASVTAAKDGIANITLLGPEGQVRDLTRAAGDTADLIKVIDPEKSKRRAKFAAIYKALNSQKIRDNEGALKAISDPLNFANLCVSSGMCDGSLAGASRSSSDVMRSAIKTIGLDQNAALMSSFFIMLLPEKPDNPNKTLIFSDCACVAAPNAEQLAIIAASSAQSAKTLIGLDPKIALLSFSTRGSARHPIVRKVEKAGQILAAAHPNLPIESAVQFDAAISESVAQIKAPGSLVAGQANIFIFPNLDAGNIGYKIAERLGGAKAIGPIFQGLNRPANDLSRGCSENDIYNMIAVTAVQAQHTTNPA